MTAQEDANVLKQMCEWLGLEAEEASKFVGAMMERRGHKMVPSWVDGDDKGGKSSEPDNIFGISTGKKVSGGSNWQYK